MSTSGLEKSIDSKFGNSAEFAPFIDEIRFPEYKALRPGTRIELNWPIVALTGPNGTNKSSILQALSAAPEGRSLAQFWFSTEVDDIDSAARNVAGHRFIYKYSFDSGDVKAECRKYRGSKKYRSSEVPKSLQGRRDPDYWEPTKRVASDKMDEIPTEGFDAYLSRNRDRWNQIRKNVIYLDFRSELSAFDKYIHHQSFNHYVSDGTQKRYKIVRESKWVARALSGKSLPKREGKKLITTAALLSDAKVNEVRKILGKPIDEITSVKHKFFGPEGYTVRLRLARSNVEYSEAHAGSGEYAVVRLVDSIMDAEERSLILLDEPEVSLHPGAQVRLIEFIQRQVLARGHQVVLSTHSPSLASNLPSKAIKVLGFEPENQQVYLAADGCSATEAFTHLGHSLETTTRPKVIVEDDLAAELVRASLRVHSPSKLDSMDVIPMPGGADGLVKNVLATLALSGNTKSALLLDGDQMTSNRCDPTDCTIASDISGARDMDSLKELWVKQFHKTEPNLFSDSDKARDYENMKRCTEWANDHLGFLPYSNPEEALANALKLELPEGPVNWKRFWEERTRTCRNLTANESVNSTEILAFQVSELAVVERDCDLFGAVSEEIDRIIDW